MMKKVLPRLFALLLAVSLALPVLPASAENQTAYVTVYLDGNRLLHSDAKPRILNDRTIVPIYQLTHALGASVTWDGATGTVGIVRAGTTIKMTIGDKTAYVNGQPVAMDVAPVILEDRTFIPAAYVAQFFGQSVTWDGEKGRVYIAEDKSAVGESNLEAWALPMGYYLNGSGAYMFGGMKRTDVDGYETTPKDILGGNSWNINSRADLIDTVLSMTGHGHNDNFFEAAALANSMSPSEYRQLLAQSGEVDSYMWPYTKQLSQKWGDRGIMCWDLFRMSNLVQWGYIAGYVTYPEALVLLEPAVTLLKENFSSWDEAFENYVEGYNWWARNDVTGLDVWDMPRGGNYQLYKNNFKQFGPSFFDDALFKTDIIPVPGLTIDDILATL